MNSYNPLGLQNRPTKGGGRKYFSLEEANRSLVLVKKVVKDILGLYCRAKIVEDRYSILDPELDKLKLEQYKQEYRTIVERTKIYERELEEIGVQLVDWRTGAIEWPAIIDGREVYLCWRVGDPEVCYYRELYESFPIRRRIKKLSASQNESKNLK